MSLSLRSQLHCLLALLLGAAVLALPALEAQTVKTEDKKAKDKEKPKSDSKQVSFRTTDGVEIQGTFYPPAAGASKDACVLFLHNIHHSKGGGSHQDGWDALAAALQKEGYPVLSFDFRGFGHSKSVDKAFWDQRRNPHNARLKGAAKMPESIDQKDFYPGYYLYLVNDIAAAKAYLDRRNDARDLNDSNLILVGAGEGATLGALWLASECRRHKDKASLVPFSPPDLDQPECKDVSCAVWLSIGPSLGRQSVPVKSWLVEAGRDHKVPMAFIYGKKDTAALNLAQAAVAAIKPKTGKYKFDPEGNDPRVLTGEKPIPDTNLAGSQLLQKSLKVDQWIVRDYLGKVMERPTREWRKRDAEKFAYVWSTGTGSRPVLAKKPGEETPLPVPLQMFLPR